eukprot:jgi/Mesen1/6876/ME000352S05931
MGGPSTVAQAARLCIFDSRRGQKEGEEADKLLAFFPSYTSLLEQLVFSPGAPCDSMDAEKHRHIFFQCEPDIWMVLVVEKGGQAGLEEGLRDAALRAVLREAHALFCLFFGRVRALLVACPDASLVRHLLQPFLPDYLSGVGGKKWRVPGMADGLTERGTVHPMVLDRSTHLLAQTAAAQLESSHGGAAVAATMLLFHNLVVCTSLSAGPATRPLAHDAWYADAEGFLHTCAWGADEEGHCIAPTVKLTSGGAGSEEEEAAAEVAGRQMERGLTVLLLLRPDRPPGVTAPALVAKVEDKLQQVEEALARSWGGPTAAHIPGHRYLCLDRGGARTARASPPVKVGTLSKESLVALNQVRGEVDADKWRHAMQACGGGGGGGASVGGEAEVCVRAHNDAWVMMRRCASSSSSSASASGGGEGGGGAGAEGGGGAEVYDVMERASETLLRASDAVDKLSQLHFGGAFLSY